MKKILFIFASIFVIGLFFHSIAMADCASGQDQDDDTVCDNEDACPCDAGQYNCDTCIANGCPDINQDGSVNADDVSEASQTCVADADGDGIPDADDNCPNEPGPSSTHGCPFANFWDKISDFMDSFHKDTDGDGFIDLFDNCPKVANADQKDTNIDGIGDACTDSDGDEVFDDKDTCSDTPAGTEVDAKGCPLSTHKDVDGDDLLDDGLQISDAPNLEPNPGPRGNGVQYFGDNSGSGCSLLANGGFSVNGLILNIIFALFYLPFIAGRSGKN